MQSEFKDIVTTLSARPKPVAFTELHSLLLNHEFINGSSFSSLSLSSSTPSESINQSTTNLSDKSTLNDGNVNPNYNRGRGLHIVVVVDVPINELSPITISNGTPMIPILDAKFAMAAIILLTLVINATTTHPMLLHT